MNSIIKENFTAGKIYKAYSYAEFLRRVELISKEVDYRIGMIFKKNNYIKITLSDDEFNFIELAFNKYDYEDYNIYILEVVKIV